MEKLDCKGQACPLPVMNAKKVLAGMGEAVLEVVVDNKTAMHNLENLGKSLKIETASEERGDAEFAVTFTKGAQAADTACEECQPLVPAGSKVVVLSGELMGSGDDELGATLMKAFVFALTQQDELPAAILAYNGGVHLTVEGSPVLDDLKKLAEAGVEIFSCGTCLNHFGIADKLAVGEVTNMYVIVQKQLEAGVVVRP